ncbi:Transcriptional regulatory protein TcrA [Pseudobythopirellula maris]|uniref:Transcriptional regulatory protein TcrA n=1 Tax=Pseudobythopirellula maris TaxID=2527991 RepID=A0A5C5ZTC1_9BACT|nr:response regulator [Pseudobythopirellula maris]TWT90794.1 Transcriptional regulatory protein TcrA [Pseudobythopirellula maris]
MLPTNGNAILHVDDSPDMTALVAKYLGDAGYRVESLNNPLDAIATIERGQFRIVLLDIDMPQKSGMHLLSEIKSLDAGIQVIMLTSLVSVTTVLESMQEGAEACFFKPLSDPEPLLEAVADSKRRCDRWWHAMRDLTQRRREECSGAAGEEIEAIEIS